jgi:hypothetical protein
MENQSKYTYVITTENTSDMPQEFYEENQIPIGKLAFTIAEKPITTLTIP